MHHYDCRWDVEEHYRCQPEHDVRWSQLGRGADPSETNDVENLRERQVAKAEFLLELGAVQLDQVLGLEELLFADGSFGRVHAMVLMVAFGDHVGHRSERSLIGRWGETGDDGSRFFGERLCALLGT